MSLQRCLAATLAVAVGAMLAFSASTSAPAQAQEDDPQTIVETFFEEVTAGDVDAAVALLADSFVLTDIDGGSFAAVGKPAFRFILEESANVEIDVRSIDAEGNTVTGVIAFSDDFSSEAGVDRYLQPFVITLNDDGLITRGDFTYDESDPQTREYLEFLDEQEQEEEEHEVEEELPPGAVTVDLAGQAGGNQPGQLFIFDQAEAGVSGVFVQVEPGPEGVQQPAHFHTGTCASPGPVVHPLANVLDGESFTFLSAGTAELVDQGLIVNVHLSTTQTQQYVACGEVISAAAQPTPVPTTVPTTAPAATPTRPAGIVAPDTGTGGGSGGSTNGLLFALAALGGVAMGAGALRLVAARMR